MEILPELRDFVRHEPNLASGTLVVRGGPDTADKLMAHAERMQRAYVLDGAAVLGVSAFAALDDIGSASLDGIYGERLDLPVCACGAGQPREGRRLRAHPDVQAAACHDPDGRAERCRNVA